MVLAGSRLQSPAPQQKAARSGANHSLPAVFFGLMIVFTFEPREVFGADQMPLVFLGDKDYPPVTYLEDGVAKGIDVDLARALAAPMKKPVRVDLMDWNLAQEKILNGEAGALTGLTISDERKKLFDFAEPTLTREFGLVVRSGEMTIHSADDLKGKNVGVTAGGFPRKFMSAQPGVNLVLIDDYQAGFARLRAGKIDAVAADLWVATYLIEKGGVHGVTVVEKPFATAQEAIAVKKGNLALLQEINRGIEKLKADGTLAKIESDWRPQEMVFASREKIRKIIVAGAGVFLAILLGVMGAWILTLKRQIQTRRKTEQALRESEEKFSKAFRTSPDVMSITDFEKNCYLEVNDAHVKTFGFKRGELIGRTPAELGIFLDPAIHEKLHRELKERGLVRGVEIEGRTRDGRRLTLLHSAEIIELGGRLCVLRVSHDITERKRAETERDEARSREAQARAEYTLQLIAAQEAERTRIARELHDSLGQNLLLIKNRAEIEMAKIKTPAELRGELQGISDIASQAIAEVRQISYDLHPPQLDFMGLTRALRALIETTRETGGVAIDGKFDSVDDLFPREAGTNVYRIVQESLNNILKHSRAKTAGITLERDVHEVLLKIEDDGCGFEAGMGGNGGKGLGLKNIAERVRMLGGKLKLDSQPGRGTCIEITIPISAEHG